MKRLRPVQEKEAVEPLWLPKEGPTSAGEIRVMLVTKSKAIWGI